MVETHSLDSIEHRTLKQKLGAIQLNHAYNTFRLEILFVLIAKVALIICLKLLFFNEPIDEHLTRQHIDQLVLGQSARVTEFVSERICGNSDIQLKSSIHSSRISIGIVECYPSLLSTVGDDANLAVKTLLTHADNAMKQARLQGENSYVTATGGDVGQI